MKTSKFSCSQEITSCDYFFRVYQGITKLSKLEKKCVIGVFFKNAKIALTLLSTDYKDKDYGKEDQKWRVQLFLIFY